MTQFKVTDRRQASQAASPPEAELDRFHLDSNAMIRDLWPTYLEHVKNFRIAKKWIKEFQNKVYRMSKNRPLYLDGAEVATYTQDGNFTESWFLSEQPDLAAQYTRPVTENKLDREALRRDHPEVYERYRAATMRLVNDPQVVPE